MNAEQREGMQYIYDVLMYIAACQGLASLENPDAALMENTVDELYDKVVENLAGNDMITFFMLYSRPDGEKMRGVEVQINLRPTDGSEFVSIDDPEDDTGASVEYVN